MPVDPRVLTATRDLQEFHLPSGDPGDHWWPPTRMVLQVVWRLSHEVDRPQQPGMVSRQWDSGRELWIKEDRDSLFLWRPGLFSLSLNLKEGRAEAQICQKFEWQSILRVLYFFGLVQQRGLLLHASSLVRRGMAYVFPGASGAGKTTIVRLSPELPYLTDEATAVQMTGNCQVLGHGTPFFGDYGRPGEKLTVPVKGLYFPIQAQENRVVPLTSKETAQRLLSCVWVFTTNPERLEAIFDLTLQLAERLPGHLLYFRPEPDFWQAIDAS